MRVISRGLTRVMTWQLLSGSNRGGVLQQHPIHLDEDDLKYAAGFDLIHTTNNGFTDGLLLFHFYQVVG